MMGADLLVIGLAEDVTIKTKNSKTEIGLSSKRLVDHL